MRYLSRDLSLRYDRERCMGCGRCVEVCPHRVFALEKGRALLVDFSACMECGACARNCPVDAIVVASGTGCAVAVLNGIFTDEESCDCGADGEDCC